MAAGTPPRTRRRPVQVARFGFDHGWLCLNPTFLNLQLPVLIIDHHLLPEPELLGLEPFGSRNPVQPLPDTTIVIQAHPGAMISLWNHTHTRPGQLVCWHRAERDQPRWSLQDTTASAVVIVGDTHRIQLSWAALWDGHIGRAQLIDPTQPRPGEPAGTNGQARSGTGACSA
ncbi:hypothetical protein [Microlunatus ginsengisoli]|uniref:Uncharacterized protein n=1 Tax=Microlunatus ginsengisoli TaxID=363863 RepID=A0ABP6ZMJ4_9ACTN